MAQVQQEHQQCTSGIPFEDRTRRRHLLRDHWLIRHGSKVVVALVLAGLAGGLGWLIVDMRDVVRDQSHEVEQLPELRQRVRKVETDVSAIREGMNILLRRDK